MSALMLALPLQGSAGLLLPAHCLVGNSALRCGGRHSMPMLSSALPSTFRTSEWLETNASPKAEKAGKLKPPALPSRPALLKFALPALALWLSGPLLSLVDTSVVGLSAAPGAGALQLAALGPATTFCDGCIFLFAFLNTATTNLYASAKAAEDERAASGGPTGDISSSSSSEAVVRRAAKVALSCSVLLVPLLLAFARPLLSLYVGPAAAADAALIGPATTYVMIRTLALPAALLGGVMTAALLGAKDSLTPLLATAVSTAANVLLDLLAVSQLKLGLAGAALATLIAQWLGTLVLVQRARTRLLGTRGFALAPAWLRRRQQQRAGRSAADAAKSVPTSRFLQFAAPVLVLVLGKIAAYGFLTHTAAALGALPLAAHQIGLSLFFFLTPFSEVVSQTGQAYLPGYSPPSADAADEESGHGHDSATGGGARGSNAGAANGADAAAAGGAASAAHASSSASSAGLPLADADEWRAASDAFAAQLLRYAVCISSACALVGAAVPLIGTRLLTNDPLVQLAVRPLALPLAASAFLCGPIGAAEGILLARRQLRFLAGTYLATVAVLPAALLAVKASPAGSVRLVWVCFAVFQLFRASAFAARVWGPPLIRRAIRRLAPTAAAEA